LYIVSESIETAEIIEPLRKRDASGEIVTVGRRKEASARVRVKPGTGKFTVNGKTLEEYLARDTLVRAVRQVFDVTGTTDKFDIRARCTGGGLAGQAGALRLGVARALFENDNSLKPKLRSFGMLTRDAREVERKKYGQPKARKRFQFSKR
jgi:small subunit ribosomal protein S9